MKEKLKVANDYWRSFSFFGLTVGALFFAASVTPSLLPRHYFVQGVLSGFAMAVGNGLGVAFIWVYFFFGIPPIPEKIQRVGKWVSVVGVAFLTIGFLWQMTFWQNSIRQRMSMPEIESTYPHYTAAIALIVALLLVSVGRLLVAAIAFVSTTLKEKIPPRVATSISIILVFLLLALVGSEVVWKGLIRLADSIFANTNQLVDDGVEPPQNAFQSGSESSLITWDSIGRQGKKFIASGPSQEAIASFLGRDAKHPLRVYAGMESGKTPEERAELALQELIRVGAFHREILIVATPTGTGWLDPGAVDTIEYLHAGDTAIVSTQYSYLPSWITILVDPRRSIESADALFEVIYAYWKTLPKDGRPRLYLHGLSLGSLGSEMSADLYSIFEDPIQGAVWSGPPFPSQQWKDAVSHRVPSSHYWLPKFRDGRLLRFTSQTNTIDPNQPWGPIRNVYVQYASDPMVFFSSSLVYKKPAWLQRDRGPDVSPYLEWYPIITFLQIAFDLPMATSVPVGYGHNYAPEHYIDAWYSVTDPNGWNQTELNRLKEHFRTSR